MKRFLTIIAATAVAAAITIPAVADSGDPADELGTFATCLRAHDIPVPANLEGVAIKQWIGAHHDASGMEAAFAACDPKPQGDKTDGAPPERLVACLRAKGLQPPADLAAFKRFTLTVPAATLEACGLAAAREDKRTCGEEKTPARETT
jgi:hypothetical protein